MSNVISKLGAHSLGSNLTGWRDFLNIIAAAGRRIAVVNCHDDFSAINDAVDLWPDVLTCGAFTQFDQLPFHIDTDWPKFAARAALNPKVKNWELLNEEDNPLTYAAKADLYCQVLPLFHAQGWGLVAFNCSSGTPPYPHEDGGESYSQIKRVIQFAHDNGYKLYTGLHGYGYDRADQLLRYRSLADYIHAAGLPIEIILTEYGPDEASFVGVQNFVNWCESIDAELMKDNYVKGACLWTLGGGGWGAVNFASALWDAKHGMSPLGSYMASVEPVTPPKPSDMVITVMPDVSALEVRVTPGRPLLLLPPAWNGQQVRYTVLHHPANED